MGINRPTHLDWPDELTIDGKLTHVYEASPYGKRSLESLIWLCGHYHHVILVPNSTTPSTTRVEFHCRAPFPNLEYELNTDT